MSFSINKYYATKIVCVFLAESYKDTHNEPPSFWPTGGKY